MSPGGNGNENFDDATSGNEKHSARNPACDNCREKKVRCGREKPRCQNCVVWKANCTYSERQKRDNEASRTAQRFEEVNERLDRIENTMARLLMALEAANLRSPPTPASVSPSSSSAARARTRTTSVEMGAAPAKNQLVANKQGDIQYLGPSSLLSFTSEAETLVEERLRASGNGTPGGGGSRAEQSETMGALKRLSAISSKSSNFFPHYGHRELRMGAEGAVMGMPPREETDMLVNEYFQNIHHWFPIFDEAQFRKDVDDFYGSADDHLSKDHAWQACFNNVLLFGLYNLLAKMPPDEKDRNDPDGKRVSTFFYNAWSAIDDLEVFLGPRLRNIQALLGSTVCAIEVSRPGLSWSLLSQAARTAQAIGLHRNSYESHMLTAAQLRERKYVFWNIYILDKCLSLTLGRSTCLPDYDCDVDFPEPDDQHPFHKNFIALCTLAKIHSRIYVRLYSASAARHSEEERERAIKELDADLREWWDEWSKIFTVQNRKMIDSFEHIELQFSFYSSVTLVHRMARPGMPSYSWSDEQCLASARHAIQMIINIVADNPDMAQCGMLLWLFQYYPFTSFFVLFSAIIRNPSTPTSSSLDYPLMKGLVSYLGQMKSRNEGAAKLLTIASAFTHVAGTFLKNYYKMTENSNRLAPQQKRRRKESLPPLPAPVDEGWTNTRVARGGYPDYAPDTDFYASLPTPTPPQQQQQPIINVLPVATSPLSSAITTPPLDADFEVPAADLQAANFLRWPGHAIQGIVPDEMADAAMDHDAGAPPSADYDIDLEALMAEPIGFQMQMEQANMRGPLEFDWFRALDSWDGDIPPS